MNQLKKANSDVLSQRIEVEMNQESIISKVEFSGLIPSAIMRVPVYSSNEQSGTAVVNKSSLLFSMREKGHYWIPSFFKDEGDEDIDLWQSKVQEYSSNYFSECENFARSDDLLAVLEALSGFYPSGRKSKLIEDLKRYLPEIISDDSVLRSSSVLKSLFSLVFYSPHLPELHNRLYFDESSDCFGLNYKKHGSIMNMTVKESGEFIYSIALKGKSVSTFSGRAVIRNKKDSGKINSIFRILYGDGYFERYY